mgnify:CR=1 FL=1|tara:strand:+ start:1008 stop:1142 length:135 start_codon:yes stop_codon:yes gene_type:complete
MSNRKTNHTTNDEFEAFLIKDEMSCSVDEDSARDGTFRRVADFQ